MKGVKTRATEVEVLVGGAGPTGLMVGGALARRGVEVRVVERAQPPLVRTRRGTGGSRMTEGGIHVPEATELPPRARAKRDQIRAGAQRLFLERGFAGTSTDAIAAEAGVSKQTLYVYYPSKEELLADVLRHLIHGDPPSPLPVADRADLRSPEDIRRALSALAHSLIANLMQPDYLALTRVVVAETPRLPRLGLLFRSAVPERVLSSIAAILTGGSANGAIRSVDADAASRMLAGGLLTYALLDGLFIGDGPPRPPAPERIEAVVDLLMQALR
jgi:AcrR family transcriptional regulator